MANDNIDPFQAVYDSQSVYMDFMGDAFDTYGTPSQELYEAYKSGIRTGHMVEDELARSYEDGDGFLGDFGEGMFNFLADVGIVTGLWGDDAYTYDYGGTDQFDNYEEWAQWYSDENQWTTDWEGVLSEPGKKMEYDFGSEEFLEGQTILGNEQNVSEGIKQTAKISDLKGKTGFKDSYIGKDFEDRISRNVNRQSDRSFKKLQTSKRKMRENWIDDVYNHAKNLVVQGAVDKPYKEYSEIDKHWTAGAAEFYEDRVGWADDWRDSDKTYERAIGSIFDAVTPDEIFGGVDVESEIMAMESKFQDPQWLEDQGYETEGEARDAWAAFMDEGLMSPEYFKDKYQAEYGDKWRDYYEQYVEEFSVGGLMETKSSGTGFYDRMDVDYGADPSWSRDYYNWQTGSDDFQPYEED